LTSPSTDVVPQVLREHNNKLRAALGKLKDATDLERMETTEALAKAQVCPCDHTHVLHVTFLSSLAASGR
jgi:hypothetical protein